MLSLDEILARQDGSLAIIREFEGSHYLVFQDGRAFVLPDLEHVDYLLAYCRPLSYGIVGYSGTFWLLQPAPVLTDVQQKVVERYTGPVGDEVLAALREQAENGA